MSTGPAFLFGTTGRGASDSAALENLDKTVNRLVQAERRQSLLHYCSAGLFWGMLLAGVAVICIRLGLLSLQTSHATVVCIIAGLATSLGIRWTTRRPPLSVAILGDIRLGLKQQLSSAWELYEKNHTSAIAATIARQLPRARTADAQRVFPLSGSSGNADYVHPGLRWGRLLPAAGLLLLLLSTLEFSTGNYNDSDTRDVTVQREGKTLRSYSESLAQRARDENLAASARTASTMLTLGRRMEGGALTREAALQQLGDLRRDINSTRRRLDSFSNGSVSNGSDSKSADYDSPDNSHSGYNNTRNNRSDNYDSQNTSQRNNSQSAQSRAKDIIENAAGAVTSGDASADDLHNDTSLQQALLTADINPDEFRSALEDAANGDPSSLQKILQELHADEQAAQDAEALERASERIQSIRENLGAPTEPRAPAQSANTENADSHNNGTPGRDLFDQPPGANGETSSFVFGDQGRGQQSPAGTTKNSAAVSKEDQPNLSGDNADVTSTEAKSVQTKGKHNEGPELHMQTRAAPVTGDVTAPLQFTSAEQRRQLEAILGKQTLPAHQKDYVRRYFLELSRAISATPAEPPE